MSQPDTASLLEGIAAPKWHSPRWVTSHFPRHYSYIMRSADLIRQAERDGIPHVAPILAAFHAPPEDVRRRIGKGLWRQVHHSDLTTNAYRAAAKIFTRLDFPTIMAVPPGALREVCGMVKVSGESAVAIAARIAANRTEMREAVMLARDTMRMCGTPDPKWSLRRLREEHDRLARELAAAKASGVPFAEPWEATVDGYHFRRLISDADFAIEGREMRHCIAGYAGAARQGRETAFSITANDERASVSFSGSGYVEIKGRYNRAVSARCRKAAEEMWRYFRAARKVKATKG